MFLSTKSIAAASAAVCLSAAAAQAVTIDFNGTVGDSAYTSTSNQTISEDGFSLQANSVSQFIIDNDYSSTTVGFDDDYYEFNGTGATLTITADSGNPFDFNSILVGSLSDNGQLEFTGNFFSGGSITDSVAAIAGQYNTFFANGFTGLSSLIISANVDGTYPSFDDIVLNETIAPVPVPAGLPLLLSAFAGLAFVRRKKS